MDLIASHKTKISKKLMQLIRSIGREADLAGMNAFLAGGFVRDAVLGKKNYDLDLVVEGDAIQFASLLKKKSFIHTNWNQ